MRSFWIRWALNPIINILIGNRKGQTHRESHVKTEVQIGGMQPQTKDRGSHQKLGGRQQILLQGL
jgi:hypothetical protein